MATDSLSAPINRERNARGAVEVRRAAQPNHTEGAAAEREPALNPLDRHERASVRRGMRRPFDRARDRLGVRSAAAVREREE